MSLMEKHYPRVNEYIPERWVAKKDDPLYYGNTHPFVYGPFGYGARSCIGTYLIEKFYVLVDVKKILSVFRLILVLHES